MNKPDLYIIRIRCKKYVQRYLIMNYGCAINGHPYLVDIRKDKELNEFVHRATKTPCVSRNKWLEQFEGKKRNSEIEIRVSADIFNRHGWELTLTDETKLNSILERRCKDTLISFLSMQYVLHEDLPSAIQEFYYRCGWNERTWPSGSIEKIWQRTKPKLALYDLQTEINDFFSKIFMNKLSARKDNLQAVSL